MSLIEVKIDPGVIERGVRALEAIRDALERYLFPPEKVFTSKPKGPEALVEFDEEEEWKREQEDERQSVLGNRERER